MIKNDPTSRRIIVNAWNVKDLDLMALPPCHMMFQFYVSGPFLDILVYQRSADLFLGVPFNFASYSILLYIIAFICDKKPRYLNYTFGDTHIYQTHLPVVEDMMNNDPIESTHKLILSEKFNRLKGVEITSELLDDVFGEITTDDIQVVDYTSHKYIKGEMVV